MGRAGMRRLIGLVLVLVVLYGGYWFVGARAVTATAQAALTEARASGQADAAGFALAGFPSRFDLTIDAPVARSADGAVEWSAALIQVFMLSYRPNKVIAWFAPRQTLRLGRQTFDLTVTDMRASAAVGLSTDLPLADVTLVGTAPRLVAADGAALAAREMRAALRGAGEARYDLGVEVLDLDLPAPALPQGMPARLQRLYLDARVTLSAPLDRHARLGPPQVTAIELNLAEIVWGGMVLRADGAVSITASDQPEGRILIRATEWQQMLDLAAGAGLVAPKLLPTVQAMAAQMALSPGGDVLELPLVFANGRMSLGPLPLGPAPSLR